MTQKRKNVKEDDNKIILFKPECEYTSSCSLLEVRITPKPPCGFEIFLIKFGGQLLKRLFCLFDHRKRCACSYYYIYKNKQTTQEFILIKSLHPSKLSISGPFIAEYNQKRYRCVLKNHFKGVKEVYNEI